MFFENSRQLCCFRDTNARKFFVWQRSLLNVQLLWLPSWEQVNMKAFDLDDFAGDLVGAIPSPEDRIGELVHVLKLTWEDLQ